MGRAVRSTSGGAHNLDVLHAHAQTATPAAPCLSAPPPADEAWGFVDCEGMLWFNAARDRALLPATEASPSAPVARAASQASTSAPPALNGGGPDPAGPEVDRRFDRHRAEAWFLAACHLLAHHWGTDHGPCFDQRCGRVALRFVSRLAAAFPRCAAA